MHGIYSRQRSAIGEYVCTIALPFRFVLAFYSLFFCFCNRCTLVASDSARALVSLQDRCGQICSTSNEECANNFHLCHGTFTHTQPHSRYLLTQRYKVSACETDARSLRAPYMKNPINAWEMSVCRPCNESMMYLTHIYAHILISIGHTRWHAATDAARETKRGSISWIASCTAMHWTFDVYPLE